GGLEVDPRELREDRRHLLQIERRIVPVLDNQVELRFRGRSDRSAQRCGGSPGGEHGHEGTAAEHYWRRLGAGKTRLRDRNGAEDMARRNVEGQRDNRRSE